MSNKVFDAVETLGQPLPLDWAGTQDAVHIAVIAAELAVPLKSGDWSIITETIRAVQCGRENPISPTSSSCFAVLDPFLPRFCTPQPDEVYWFYLKPRTITGLRHVWDYSLLTTPLKYPAVTKEQAQRVISSFLTYVNLNVVVHDLVELLVGHRTYVNCGYIGDYRDAGTLTISFSADVCNIKLYGMNVSTDIPEHVLDALNVLADGKLAFKPIKIIPA